MNSKAKLTSLFFLVCALVSIVLLAASLSSLQLKSGDPFPGKVESETASQPSLSSIPLSSYSLPILRGIIALIFLILMIYVSVRLIALVNIRRIINLVIVTIVLLIIVYLMPDVLPNQSTFSLINSSEMPASPSLSYPVTPLGQPPQFFIWAVMIGIVLGIGLVAFRIAKQRQYEATLEENFLQEAKEAVNAFNAGVGLKNVIIRCYVRMTRLLQKEQGIERNYNMTASEFGNWLEREGFPKDPVYQLTYLFEKVRYGKYQLSNNDEQIALSSLQEIIQYCQGNKVQINGSN